MEMKGGAEWRGVEVLLSFLLLLDSVSLRCRRANLFM